MMLRGGKIETGRWKSVHLEKRDCVEIERKTNEEVEDCNHWLLQCTDDIHLDAIKVER